MINPSTVVLSNFPIFLDMSITLSTVYRYSNEYPCFLVACFYLYSCSGSFRGNSFLFFFRISWLFCNFFFLPIIFQPLSCSLDTNHISINILQVVLILRQLIPYFLLIPWLVRCIFLFLLINSRSPHLYTRMTPICCYLSWSNCTHLMIVCKLYHYFLYIFHFFSRYWVIRVQFPGLHAGSKSFQAHNSSRSRANMRTHRWTHTHGYTNEEKCNERENKNK